MNGKPHLRVLLPGAHKDTYLCLPIPPYEQIGLQIRTLIASAQLSPGTLLPSVRQFARDLGVAPNTIVRAYSAMERKSKKRNKEI